MGVLDAAIIVAGTVTLAAGLLLAARGLQVAHVRFIAAWFVLFGAAQVAAVWDPTNRIIGILESSLIASIVAFAVAYPGPALSTRRRWIILWIYIPALGVGMFGWDKGLKDPWLLSQIIYETLFMVSLIGVPFYLGWRAIRTRSRMERDRLVWLVVPLIFWTIHDSIRFVLPLVSPFDGEGYSLGVFAVAAVTGFVATVFAAVVLAAASFRMGPEDARSAKTFAIAVPLFVGVSLIQFSGSAEHVFPIHSLMDTLFALLLFYGIARYGLVDLRLRMRWSVKQGTIAAVFVAAFFAISESASTFLSETSGSAYFGIIGASLLVFAFAPLQRFAERLSVRAVPVSGGAESYLNYRRLHIYRAALEGALADGRVNAWEADALRALRSELDVSEEEHRLLESELKLPRGPDGFSAQAEQAI